MLSFLRVIFLWWQKATFGTLVTTWLKGKPVGSDRYGNKYYQTADGKRRWVIYNGTVDASRVPPEWHGWLHYTYDAPPTVKPLPVKPWQTQYVPNLSGTPGAYRPRGSLARDRVRPPATGDYKAWTPE